MKVLIACEYSGIVRDAFLRAGHEAMSADILPTESPGPHHYGDVREVLDGSWDLIIAHPPCTRLTLAGVRWLHERNLWGELTAACEFFRLFLCQPGRVVVENPQPHRYAVERLGRNYDQKVQPYHFGDLQSKGICLWLKNVPPLVPTWDRTEEMKALPKNQTHKVHHMAPGPERDKARSRFFPSVAEAMAEQWGGL